MVMRFTFQFFVSVTALSVFVLLGGCSSQDVSELHPFDAKIKQLLSQVEDPDSKRVLEKALKTGSIDKADYLKDIEKSLVCLRAQGVEASSETDPKTGLVTVVTASDPDQASQEKLGKAYKECNSQAGVVAALYVDMHTNPNNLPDNSVAKAVDCFKEKGLVPNNYTVSDYEKLLAENAKRNSQQPAEKVKYPAEYTAEQIQQFDACVIESSQ